MLGVAHFPSRSWVLLESAPHQFDWPNRFAVLDTGAGEGLFETESSHTVVTTPAIAGGAAYPSVDGGVIYMYT